MAVALKYYNYDKVFSFNGMLNFICGGRGLGKTYGIKEKAIAAAIKKGDMFILLRRYKDELRLSKNTFFADIAHVFPDWDFKVEGIEAKMAPVLKEGESEKKRPWQTIGYFIPLSQAQAMKGVSFPKVKTIIFDEFLIEKGKVQYIPDEAVVFLNFFSTVDRYKDKTRAFFLANSVQIENPYFLYFNIRPKKGEEWIKLANGDIICNFPDSTEFNNGVYQTRFGRLIKGSEYADYAVESTFSDNTSNLVEEKPSTARYIYSLETSNGVVSVWKDTPTRSFYIQESLPKQQIMFTLLPGKMAEGKTLLHNSDKLLQYLRTAYRQGRAKFDTPQSRIAFIEVFKR